MSGKGVSVTVVVRYKFTLLRKQKTDVMSACDHDSVLTALALKYAEKATTRDQF